MDAQKKLAARMESLGVSHTEIAELTGRTPGTVQGWHREPEYSAELEKWRERDLERIEPILDRLRIKFANAVASALDSALEALEATNDDGDPSWLIRQRAAEAIFNAPIAKTLSTGGSEGDSPTNVNAVQIVIRREGDVEVKPLEVIEHGDRGGSREDHDPAAEAAGAGRDTSTD